MLAESGLDAPLETVAKRAGVAVGPLYRHFPTRLALIQELYAGKLAAWYATVQQAAAMCDAWAALELYVRSACELQAADSGFADVVCRRVPAPTCLDQVYAGFEATGGQIAVRARTQQILRADAGVQDLHLIIVSCGLRDGPGGHVCILAPPSAAAARRLALRAGR